MASLKTRNPHGAYSAPPENSERRAKKVLQKIGLGKRVSQKERILSQWKAALGCPISDEAKERFQLQAPGSAHTFVLADVRLWREGTKREEERDRGAARGDTNKKQEEENDCGTTGSIGLEFFFDGELADLKEKAGFSHAFERLIEGQLQERRMRTFKEKFQRRQTRQRARAAMARRIQVGGVVVEEDPEKGTVVLPTTGKAKNDPDDDDDEWQAYLKSSVPSTRLEVRAFRDAGCMLRFVCVQTSLSVGATELLGQVCFPEYFLVDGVAQSAALAAEELAAGSGLSFFFSSWNWILTTLLCMILGAMTLFAWYRTLSDAALQFGLRRAGEGAAGLDLAGGAVEAVGAGGGPRLMNT